MNISEQDIALTDVSLIIIIVASTVTIQTLLIVFLGNRFLKFAFDKVQAVFAAPTMQKAFGILGGKSGESRRNKALESEIATGIINKMIGPFKLIIEKVVGINIDEMIEEYGAMEVLNTLQTFLPMLQKAGMNLDLQSIIAQVTGQQQPQDSNTEFGNIGTQ